MAGLDVDELVEPLDLAPYESAGAVVAEAEVGPIGPRLLGALAGVDIDDLDDAGLVSYAVAWNRVANHAAAQVARAVARFHHRVDPGELLSASALTSAEFSVALGLGSGAADRLVATSTALAARLPDTLAAIEEGELSWPKATVIAERTAALTPGQARRVEELVLPAAAARTPARHAEAVRRAVDRVDPAGAAERRRRAERDIALVRTHVGDGMGELFARLPSEDLDTVWMGADAWARRTKAAGDARTLDQLRVAALVRWARSFLSHGDAATCDLECEPLADGGSDTPAGEGVPSPIPAGEGVPSPTPAGEGPSPTPAGKARGQTPTGPPTNHGRPVAVRVLWDLDGVLGLADEPAELADSGALLDAATARSLIADGVAVRRLLVDETTGELIDLTPRRYSIPPLDPHRHPAPFELHIVVTTAQWRALEEAADPAYAAALEKAPEAIRAPLRAPVTATDLDANPDAYPAPAALADFVATRDRHPNNPCAGLSAARSGDLDHVVSVRDGGATVRDNLATPTRRWHRLRTLGGWTVQRTGHGWTWTSPLGRTTTTHPHDYRHGP